MAFDWTDEFKDLAAKMWGDGCSGTEIAVAINRKAPHGPGVTRRAVIGKIGRMGLARSTGTRRITQGAMGPRNAKRGLGAAARPTVPAPVEKPAAGATVTPMLLEEPIGQGVVQRLNIAAAGNAASQRLTMFEGTKGCRWPLLTYDEAATAETRFCCAPKKSGSFCAQHAAVAYTPGSVKSPKTGAELARALRRYV